MSPAHYFITGFPGFIGKRLVRAIAEQHPESKVTLLVHPDQATAANAILDAWDGELRARVTVLLGDITDMHLGLSSAEYRTLTAAVTDVFHLAAMQGGSVAEDKLRLVNVEGTRNVLELAADSQHLRRFNYMSTVFVSGTRTGVVEEDELDEGQRFRNPYEETKFEAERLVRSARLTLPISIYRPGIVVGDSRTGEIERFEGPYYLAIMLVTSPIAVPLPLPGSAVAPLNVVPIDFVIDAMLHIAHDPRGVGRTFHLVDPNPPAARKVYEEIARRTNRKLPPLRMSYRLADKLMEIPGLERLVRDQRAAIASVNHLALYNSFNTQELLDGTGIRCPRLTDYLDRLITYVKTSYRETKRSGGSSQPEQADPLQAEG